MKKASKKQLKKGVGAQAPTLADRIKSEKATVIALILAAVVFFGALYGIHAGGILHGEGEIFSVYGDELVEFEKATVTEIPYEDMEADEVADGAYTGEQDLVVIVKSGRYKGETMEVDNFFGPLSGVPVEVGDHVTITIKTRADGTRYASVYEVNRIPVMAVFLVLFFLVVILIGGRTGLKSLVGLVFTVICLFLFLIPLLLKGAPTIPSTFLTCVYVAFVCFVILGGVHRKAMSAFLGTAAGAFFAMVLGIAVQSIAKIDGLRMEAAEPLLQLKYVGATVGIKGLLVASIIICALGAVMDVAMSISSALEEVHSANPALTQKDLFRSGMNIGRDMVGTMTNTLILAFLGSEFSLMIFLYARELTFYHMFSTAFVALETISGLSASLGMVLAIPLTALISSTLITHEKHN